MTGCGSRTRSASSACCDPRIRGLADGRLGSVQPNRRLDVQQERFQERSDPELLEPPEARRRRDADDLVLALDRMRQHLERAFVLDQRRQAGGLGRQGEVVALDERGQVWERVGPQLGHEPAVPRLVRHEGRDHLVERYRHRRPLNMGARPGF